MSSVRWWFTVRRCPASAVNYWRGSPRFLGRDYESEFLCPHLGPEPLRAESTLNPLLGEASVQTADRRLHNRQRSRGYVRQPILDQWNHRWPYAGLWLRVWNDGCSADAFQSQDVYVSFRYKPPDYFHGIDDLGCEQHQGRRVLALDRVLQRHDRPHVFWGW